MPSPSRLPWSAGRLWVRIGLAGAALSVAAVAPGQDLTGQGNKPVPFATVRPQPGVLASKAKIQSHATRSQTGRTGQRRTRSDTDGIEPLARISTRVANRVQNRIRNRIDRNYDPTANATSPFKAAADRVKRTGQPRSR